LIRFYTSAIEEVHRDLNLPREVGVGGRAQQKRRDAKVAEDVVVEDVTFGYEGASRPALESISMTIERGTAVALVGASGAGKTTLADVILGLLPPDSGSVRVGGVDIHTDLPSWRQHIGYVPQSIFLLDDSIRRNIAFGLPDQEVDEQQLHTAIAMAQLESHIASLPDGVDTFVGERGVRLSGGQRQRIGIARALYRDPTFLVLDEATSAVDSATEKAIVEAVEGLRGDRTILVIAHRLTTVQRCDQLFVLRAGRFEAQGRYSELLEGCAHFRAIAAYVLNREGSERDGSPGQNSRDKLGAMEASRPGNSGCQ
jgi:ATP-binding cassette subfamily C protein